MPLIGPKLCAGHPLLLPVAQGFAPRLLERCGCLVQSLGAMKGTEGKFHGRMVSSIYTREGLFGGLGRNPE